MNDETNGVFSILPADLKPCIIEKIALLEHRFSAAGKVDGNTGWDWGTMGKLWFPTEVEVFGTSFWSDADAGWTGGGGCNKQYPIFIGGSKHLIKGAGHGGGRCGWWLASARRQSSAHVCFVGGSGDATLSVATYPWVYAPL